MKCVASIVFFDKLFFGRCSSKICLVKNNEKIELKRTEGNVSVALTFNPMP
jgi:hypothetical protein